MGDTGDSVALNVHVVDAMNNFSNLADACIAAGDLVGALYQVTKGIELSPPDEILSQFYYKRAGIHAKLKDWLKVVEDSTAAIEKSSNFSLALLRRYEGNKAAGNLEEALKDLVHFCSLGEASGVGVLEVRGLMEEILLILGRSEAEKMIKLQQPRTPSITLIQSFLEDYETDPLSKWWKGEKVANLDANIAGDSGLKGFAGAISALASKDYEKIIDLCTEELGNPESVFKDEASLLRGSFMYLWSYDKEKYLEDWDRVIDSSTADISLKTSAWIKKGRAHAQKFKNKEESVICFDKAQELSPENADVYYQRSNAIVEAVNDDMGTLMEAMKYVKRALELRPDFPYAATLLVYLEFSIALIEKNEQEIVKAVKTMDKYVTLFPKFSLVHNARGHMHKQVGEPFASYLAFDQAAELEPENMAYQGQAIVALFELNSDPDAAITALNKTLELDDKSSSVYEQLACVKHVSGDLDGALENVEKGLQTAFSFQDYMSLCSLKKALEVQLGVKAILQLQDPDLEMALINLMLC